MGESRKTKIPLFELYEFKTEKEERPVKGEKLQAIATGQVIGKSRIESHAQKQHEDGNPVQVPVGHQGPGHKSSVWLLLQITKKSQEFHL